MISCEPVVVCRGPRWRQQRVARSGNVTRLLTEERVDLLLGRTGADRRLPPRTSPRRTVRSSGTMAARSTWSSRPAPEVSWASWARPATTFEAPDRVEGGGVQGRRLFQEGTAPSRLRRLREL